MPDLHGKQLIAIPNVELVRRTELAFICSFLRALSTPGQPIPVGLVANGEASLPISQIDDRTEIREVGDRGWLVASAWWCQTASGNAVLAREYRRNADSDVQFNVLSMPVRGPIVEDVAAFEKLRALRRKTREEVVEKIEFERDSLRHELYRMGQMLDGERDLNEKLIGEVEKMALRVEALSNENREMYAQLEFRRSLGISPGDTIVGSRVYWARQLSSARPSASSSPGGWDDVERPIEVGKRKPQR